MNCTFTLDDEDEASGNLEHKTLLESFLYMIVKLRFPECLSTLLIGLLPIGEFKVNSVFLERSNRLQSS